MNWAMMSCDPTKTQAVADYAPDLPIWIAQQRVVSSGGKPSHVMSVLPGFAFIPATEWLPFRRSVPRDFNVQPYIDGLTGEQKLIDEATMVKMHAALLKTPMPNPMKVGDDVFCTVGPWAGLGGSLVRIYTSRTVRVKFGEEHVTIPRVFTKRT